MAKIKHKTINDIIYKYCARCDEWKELVYFNKNITRAYGLRSECKKCSCVLSSDWAKKNRDKTREFYKKYKKAHIEHYKELNLDYYKMREEPSFRLHRSMTIGIYRSIFGHKRNKKWESLVGYTIADLKSHLEKQFKDGMSWDNYGEWHIDHIIPKSVFNFATAEDIDFKKCWSLSNLRPLWAKDNILKSDKLIKPFQPSLYMCA